MTSTPFNVGLSDGSRLSSRVLRPPGGGHTDIFSSEPEPLRVGRRPGPNTAAQPAQPEQTAQPAESARPAPAEEPAKPTNGADGPTQNGQSQASPTEPKAAAQPTATGPTEPQQLRAEPPKRVRVPPGGFSSGLW